MSSDREDLFEPAAVSDDIQLPNAREVNKRLREERTRSRHNQRRGSADRGAFQDVLLEVRKGRAGDALAQCVRFLDKVRKRGIPAAIGRRRVLGEKRATEFGNTLMLSIADLYNARMPIQNLSDIGQKQVVALVRYWGEKALSEGTIADRVSVLRRFLQLVNKQDAVPTGVIWRNKLRQSGVIAGTIGRPSVINLPKGWLDMGIDPRPIIDEVRTYCEVVGSHLEMMWAFGPRCRECVQVRPRKADKGEHLFLFRGTKGKKEREVPFSKNPEKRAWQREILERAKLVADRHPRDELAVPGLDLEQMMNRQRYVFTKFGITEAGRGIVPHGLRHQFATEMFAELSGMPAPVLGLLPAEEYKRNWVVVRQAYLEVSRALGHERPSISGAYISSEANLNRQQKERLTGWLGQIESTAPTLEEAGISDVWLLGRCAQGMPLLPDEAIAVTARFADANLSMNAVNDRLNPVRASLERALGSRVTLTPWVSSDVPAEAAEVMFTPGRAAGAQNAR